MGSKRSVTFGSIRSYPDRTGYEQDRSWYDRTGSILVRKRKKIDLSTVRVRSIRIGSERSVKYLDRSWNGKRSYPYRTQFDLGSVPDRSGSFYCTRIDLGTIQYRSVSIRIRCRYASKKIVPRSIRVRYGSIRIVPRSIQIDQWIAPVRYQIDPSTEKNYRLYGKRTWVDLRSSEIDTFSYSDRTSSIRIDPVSYSVRSATI